MHQANRRDLIFLVLLLLIGSAAVSISESKEAILRPDAPLSSSGDRPPDHVAAAAPDSSAFRIQDALHALRLNPSDWQAHLELGEVYQQLGNLPAARFHLESALRSASGPDSLRAAFLEARVLLQLGLRLRATRALGDLVEHPEAPPGASHDLSLLLRADRFRAEALMAGMRAIERSGEAVYMREAAQQWKELKRPDASIQLLELLATRPEARAEDAFQLGLLAHRAQRPERAQPAYERALLLDPAHPEAHYNLALILEQTGEIDRAVYHLERVLRLRPHYEPAYFQLGQLFLGHDRRSEAVSVFQRYLLAGQDSLALSEARALLQELETEGDLEGR